MGGDLQSASGTIKILYSYGGKILPSRINGKLRYVGGHTRVLSVDRSVSYAELMVKFGELCGSSMVMRCQLPNEDMDLLVTVTSDEEFAGVIEEYDRASPASKIKVVLSPPKSLKTVSPVSSTTSSVDSSDSRSIATIGPRLPPSPPMVAGHYAGPPLPPPPLYPTTAAYRCRSQFSPPIDFNHNVRGGCAARLHYNPLHDGHGRSRRYY